MAFFSTRILRACARAADPPPFSRCRARYGSSQPSGRALGFWMCVPSPVERASGAGLGLLGAGNGPSGAARSASLEPAGVAARSCAGPGLVTTTRLTLSLSWRFMRLQSASPPRLTIRMAKGKSVRMENWTIDALRVGKRGVSAPSRRGQGQRFDERRRGPGTHIRAASAAATNAAAGVCSGRKSSKVGTRPLRVCISTTSAARKSRYRSQKRSVRMVVTVARACRNNSQVSGPPDVRAERIWRTTITTMMTKPPPTKRTLAVRADRNWRSESTATRKACARFVSRAGRS